MIRWSVLEDVGAVVIEHPAHHDVLPLTSRRWLPYKLVDLVGRNVNPQARWR